MIISPKSVIFVFILLNIKSPLFFSFFLFIIAFNAFSQVPAIQWQKYFGGANFDESYDIQNTSDGGFILLSMTASNDGDVSGNQGGLVIFGLQNYHLRELSNGKDVLAVQIENFPEAFNKQPMGDI